MITRIALQVAQRWHRGEEHYDSSLATSDLSSCPSAHLRAWGLLALSSSVQINFAGARHTAR